MVILTGGIKSNYILAAAVLVLAAAATTTAQQIPACASKLVPCANYLNSTKPPASCCDPMKEAVKNELPCLCSLYSDPGLLKSFGIDVAQAMKLPQYCGITSDTSICSKSGATPPSSPKTPPATSSGGSASGGGSSGKKDNSGALGRSSCIGMPGLVSLVFFALSVLAF